MSSVREDTAKKMFLAMLIADNTDEDIEITDKDWDEFVLHHGDVSFWLDQADQILSHPRIAILAEDQSSMREPPTCPQCQAILHRVRRGGDSPLNADQFDAVKAGDWYCSVCAGAEAKHTTYKYWWEKDLDMPPDPIFKRIEVKSE